MKLQNFSQLIFDSWFILLLISFCNLFMVDLVLLYSRLSLRFSYIQRVSEQLKRALNKHNIKATLLYTQTTLRSLLSKPKDPIPKEDRNNAV